MDEAAPIIARPEARAPRGFQDRRAPEVEAERDIVAKVSAVYERYGFEALSTSAFEYADALGKFLPDADRPNVGVFALRDDEEGDDGQGSWMALRYDLTAPLARFAAERWETLPKPFRRYAFGPVWRNEKPGPGRFREFTQCDADTVGSARPEADAEIIAMACEGLEAAGLAPGHAVLKINSRKLLDGLLERVKVSSPLQKLRVLRALDKFDRLGAEGVLQLLEQGRLDESGDFTEGAGLSRDDATLAAGFCKGGSTDRAGFLSMQANVVGGTPSGDEGLRELDAMRIALTAMGVGDERAVFDASVVRGLEYYTGPVFEAELLLDTVDERGRPVRFGSIGGGGRYDDLVARFTGERVPATGFSFGVSRLAAALQAAGRGGSRRRGPVVVIAFSPERMADYFAVVGELRAAGVAAEVYLGAAGLKAQMKYADRRGAPFAVLLGDDELAAGEASVKDLDAGAAAASAVADNSLWKEERPGQFRLPRPRLAEAIRARLQGRA